MKYLCLVYLNEQEFYSQPDAQIAALHEEAAQLVESLQGDVRFLAADALAPTKQAATVRRRAGTVSVTDGPFAETREQLAGFMLLDAANLDEAIGLAARIPSARFGSIEIRPVRSIEADSPHFPPDNLQRP